MRKNSWVLRKTCSEMSSEKLMSTNPCAFHIIEWNMDCADDADARGLNYPHQFATGSEYPQFSIAGNLEGR
ncbi:hypothetical protein ig2599ANME_1358 [groundwater metagenome]